MTESGRGRGEAGRRGDDVRSDVRVALEIRDSGGVEIELRSKVANYYGESIEAQVRDLLGSLGVAAASVDLDDSGALPFVLAARVEAAAARAGVHGPEARTSPRPALPPASPRERLRRSRLYLPGNEPKFMINAGLHRPDGVILDLEDSVHHDEKDAARALVRHALRAVDFGGAERMVRVNPLPPGLEDLAAVVPEGVDLILIPKAEDVETIRAVDEAIAGRLRETGIDRNVWLMPILETALGVERAFEIATASPRIVALTIGLEDYTADLGVVKTPEGSESVWARQRLVNAARAAGVQAIDSVYGDVADVEGLRLWAERSRSMGFEGMGCVHPRQIAVLHAAFAPTVPEIDRARRIEEAYLEAERKGIGVVSLGSKMIDAPVVERARRLLRRARAMGLAAADEGEKA